jgi:hypothetical protein
MTAILYTLVFVLAFPTLAWTECAWVLWREDMIDVGNSAWSVHLTTSIPAACEKELEATLKYAAKTGWRITRINATTGVIQGYGAVGNAKKAIEGSVVSRFICLPDTVDPREAKGTAR